MAPASNYFSKIEVVFTPDSLPIGTPDQIKLFKGSLYFTDEQRKNLFKIPIGSGTSWHFNQFGEGPDTYSQVTNFELDSIGNLYILDALELTLTKYHSSGQFIKRIKLRVHAKDFIILHEFLLLYHDNNSAASFDECALTIYNLDLEQLSDPFEKCLINSKNNIDQVIDYAPMSLYVYHDTVRLWSFGLGDVIYKWDPLTKNLHHVLEFKYPRSSELVIRRSKDIFSHQASKNILTPMGEYNNYVVFSGFDQNMYQLHLIYTKSEQVCHNNKFDFDIIDHGLVDDFMGLWPIWPYYRLNDSMALDYFHGFRLKEKMQHPAFFKQGMPRRKNLDTLFARENPIFRVLYFKAPHGRKQN